MADAINPSHYKRGWSNDAELISITENLTSNGAQAVQYVARSTRLTESLNKSKDIDGRIEDLNKAAWFIAREILRLKAEKLKRIVPGGGMDFINIAKPINIGPAMCDVMVHNVSSLDEAISIKVSQDKQGKPITNREKQVYL